MPRDIGEEVRARLRRTDPEAALAGSLLPRQDAAPDESPTQAGPVAHLRARDPRARLDAAAMELHGGRADFLPRPPGEPEAPEAPPKRSLRPGAL